MTRLSSDFRAIATRYRDVPFEEIQACVFPHTPERIGYIRALWPDMRGTAITVVAPPYEEPASPCAEPKYRKRGSRGFVCPCMAEIGD